MQHTMAQPSSGVPPGSLKKVGLYTPSGVGRCVASQHSCRQLLGRENVHDPMVHRAILQRTLGALLCMFTVIGYAHAQTGVSINTTGAPPNQTAVLDLREPNAAERTKGLLIPRIALTATNAAAPVTAPANGLYVYNTATTNFTGADAQYNVSPGFYLWDVGQRWVRHETQVRRPTLYATNTTISVSNGSTFVPISGTISAPMDLRAGDRVWFKGHGTATPSGQGHAQGQAEIAVDSGGGYGPLPNGSGTTSFALDNAITIVSATVSVLHRGNFANWGVSGYYDVTVNGTYTFAMGMRLLSGDVEIASGGSNLPGALLIEVVRP